MKESKLKKLKLVSIGFSTATSMSNTFKILSLGAILPLDCHCDKVLFSFASSILLSKQKAWFLLSKQL